LGWFASSSLHDSSDLPANDELPHSPPRNHRLETLILFVEAIFLLFSSVYICKESIEHVLLLGHDHGSDFYECVSWN
jgi:divalent metal cation (Fe/Co/Zn/Cd) transporter